MKVDADNVNPRPRGSRAVRGKREREVENVTMLSYAWFDIYLKDRVFLSKTKQNKNKTKNKYTFREVLHEFDDGRILLCFAHPFEREKHGRWDVPTVRKFLWSETNDIMIKKQ